MRTGQGSDCARSRRGRRWGGAGRARRRARAHRARRLGGRGRGARPRRRAPAEPRASATARSWRWAGSGSARPRTGSPRWPGARRGDLPDPRRRATTCSSTAASVRRYRGTIPRINPAVLVDVRAGAAPPQPAGAARPARRALGGAERGEARRPDRRHLDAPQHRHEVGPDAARARHRGGLGRPARGHVAPARALLHPLGGQPRAAVRHRGRRAAGPLRGRLAADRDPDGGGARRGAARARGAGAPHRARRRRRDRARRRRRSRAAAAPSSRYRPRSRAGSPTTRRCPATATSSPSACRSARSRSAWRSTPSRSGAPRACPGEGASDRGPVRVIFDNSPPDGSPGVLLGFLEGRHARELGRLRPDERRTAVIDCFARLFGPRAATPGRLRRAPLGRGGVDARLLRLPHAHRGVDELRPRAAPADRPAALGRRRVRARLERLHGRRGALRRGAPRPRCSKSCLGARRRGLRNSSGTRVGGK